MNEELGRNAEIAAVLARHQSELLGRANVVGVASGTRMRSGRPTGEACLIVFVERKLAETALAPGDVLPREIGGVPVDVVESGRIEPQHGG